MLTRHTALGGVLLAGFACSCATVKPAGPPVEKRIDALPFGDGMSRPVPDPGNPPLQYSAQALAAGVEGQMLLQCVLMADGSLKNCRVLKPLPHMTEEALGTVSKWKYTPVVLEGKAVNVRYVIPIRLRLPATVLEGEVASMALADVAGLAGCATDQRRADPTATGTLTLQIRVEPSGSVAEVTPVAGAPDSTAFAQCVAARVKRWTFSSQAAPRPAVLFPFNY